MVEIVTVKCDGCDHVQTDRETLARGVTITITGSSISPKQFGGFDLCASCCTRLQSHIDPREWPRAECQG